ncbi:MAG: hypothetical protein BGO87_03250 [Flavobacteriia bacterium 40-80]|nr:MAG: hypothetical protein BGO87_03250 [Flavobacteriia bacterium 40-80]
MNLTGIISISGKPGLYKVIAQSKNSIIVESLDNNKRVPAYATDRISAIEDISIYTYEDDVPLKDVFSSIYSKENGQNTISHKEDVKKLEDYLAGILPDYDRERVYPSDIRKIFQWYNMLNEKGFIKMEEEETEAVATEEEASKTEEKPKKTTKATAKKETSKEEKPKAEKAPAAPKAAKPAAGKPTAAKKPAAPKKKKED